MNRKQLFFRKASFSCLCGCICFQQDTAYHNGNDRIHDKGYDTLQEYCIDRFGIHNDIEYRRNKEPCGSVADHCEDRESDQFPGSASSFFSSRADFLCTEACDQCGSA